MPATWWSSWTPPTWPWRPTTRKDYRRGWPARQGLLSEEAFEKLKFRWDEAAVRLSWTAVASRSRGR